MDAPSTILIDKIGAEKGDDFKLTVLIAARGCALGMMLYATENEAQIAMETSPIGTQVLAVAIPLEIDA